MFFHACVSDQRIEGVIHANDCEGKKVLDYIGWYKGSSWMRNDIFVLTAHNDITVSQRSSITSSFVGCQA